MSSLSVSAEPRLDSPRGTARKNLSDTIMSALGRTDANKSGCDSTMSGLVDSIRQGFQTIMRMGDAPFANDVDKKNYENFIAWYRRSQGEEAYRILDLPKPEEQEKEEGPAIIPFKRAG